MQASGSAASQVGDPWTVARRAPLSVRFPRQEYWRGLPFPSPGDLLDQGIEPGSPAWQTDSLPPEPPGKLQGVRGETQNRLHLIPRPDEGPWTSHPADPDLSFLFCKRGRRAPPFKASREGEMRADLCGRTRRLLFSPVPGSAQGHSRQAPPSVQLPPQLGHHDRQITCSPSPLISVTGPQAISKCPSLPEPPP